MWIRQLFKSRPISYDDVVRKLPVPSWDQCERFIRYLAEAHSWYKLPVDHKHPFSLFLDPTAGCQMVYRDNKPFPVEIIPPVNHLLTTQWYRAQFGFWNYHQTPEGFSDSPESPSVWLSDGTRILLSDDWAKAGLALLDAFIHPNPPLAYIIPVQNKSWE
jgi:hypothetical protein